MSKINVECAFVIDVNKEIVLFSIALELDFEIEKRFAKDFFTMTFLSSILIKM